MSTPRTEQIERVQRELLERLGSGDLEGFREELLALHPSDLADLLESLETDEERLALVNLLPAELAGDALSEMEEEEDPGELLAVMDPEKSAELLHEMDVDDATDLVQDLAPPDQERILAELPVEEAGEIRDLLLYDEESAGGLMDTALVSVPHAFTAGQAITEIRRKGREVEDFYTVFVVDEEGHLLGTVPLDDLILADPLDPVAQLVEPVMTSVFADEDQEEVGRLLSRYNLVSIPVVDEVGLLLGRVTFDDAVDVLEAEQTEDILRLAGVSEEEELRAGSLEAVRTRLPWLILNLVTATVAASIVLSFTATIEEMVILAFLMPIIAALGGNAGSQALAVTVRRLAVSGDLGHGRYEPVRKETVIGLVNGAVLGIAAAGLSLVVGGNPMLGLVVLMAMWGNLVMAGFAGSFIPTILNRLGADPAVASGVFVHALTDFLGFLLLLGLASALLL